MTRIQALRIYMCAILEELLEDDNFSLNVNFIDTKPNNYSINLIPNERVEEKFINGTKVCQDTYYFVSRKEYTLDLIENMENIGFFEELIKLIETKNNHSILPSINGIESIECLDCGGLQSATPETALFSIQIRIKYLEDK